MGIYRRAFLAACAFTLAPVTGVDAADFRIPPAQVVPVPSPIPVPDYNLWYLRGDISWAHHEDPDISVAGAPFSGEEMDDTWAFGGGFGYVYNDRIRGDITIDHRLDADVTGTDTTTGSTHTAELSSTVFLANVYYDVRRWESFSPYLGVGLGFTSNDTGNRTITTGGVQTGATGGNGDTDFAFAAMAGVSIPIRDGWLFDAGYRYLNLGDAKTDAAGSVSVMGIGDIQAHEFRFGVRYEFR
jgi:opacity protein-like surface antigen